MLLRILSCIRERFEKIRGYLVRPVSVSGRTRFRFQNDNMAIEVWCLHRPAGYLSEILKICGLLTGMEVKCVSHMLRDSLYYGFRPCHSVFIGGGLIFRPGRGEISNSNAGRRLGRASARPSCSP